MTDQPIEFRIGNKTYPYNCIEKIYAEDKIIQSICNYFHIEPQKVLSRTRKREILIVRQLIQYMMKWCVDKKLIPPMSLAKIGEVTGGYDHATVLHSIRTINNLQYLRQIRLILFELKGIMLENFKEHEVKID